MSPEVSSRLWIGMQRGTLAAGLILLGFWGIAVVSTRIYQHGQLRAVDRSTEVRRVPSAAIPPFVDPRAVIGRIDIARVGVSSVIREGVDPVSLLLGVGHIPGTAWPGQPGNTVLAGHRDTFFRPLREASTHDTIRIVTSYGRFSYEIISREIVAPSQTELLDRDRLQGVTLVTCYPFRYLGPAPRRLVISARQVDPPIAPSQRVASRPLTDAGT